MKTSRKTKIQVLKEQIANWDVPRLGFAGLRRLEMQLKHLQKSEKNA